MSDAEHLDAATDHPCASYESADGPAGYCWQCCWSEAAHGHAAALPTTPRARISELTAEVTRLLDAGDDVETLERAGDALESASLLIWQLVDALRMRSGREPLRVT
jgi:hypothetical protein